MSSTKPDVLDETFGEGVVSPISKDVLESFFLSSKDANRSVCIITSGGTQVPLETRMVRSIENFSTGRRGACMVEALLDSSIESEYSVLLLMRTGTTLPFARNFTISTVSDAVQFKSCANGVRLHSPIAKAACTQLNQVLQQNRLLIVEYTTVEQYLLGLRLIANKSTVLGARVLFCLAAAVSDYYVPSCERNTHKMESTGDVLTLKLHKVPKCLGYLKSEWAPLSFVASFKLETDDAVLRAKSLKAIEKYGVDTVVANILETRYHTLRLFDKNQHSEQITVGDEESIENELVRKLLTRHRLHAQQNDVA